MIPSAALLTIIAVTATPSPAAAQPLDQAALLRMTIDLDRLAYPAPPGQRTAMFSSYDRKSRLDPATGEQLEWDANADWGQFIREEDGWQVMAEAEGPGVITRIWSANPAGQIRFILDGKTVIDAPFANLFNGELPPFAEPLCYVNPHNGGKNCYFPIGYNQSCKVIIRDSKSYYQINTLSFPKGTQVVAFTPQLDEAAEAAMTDVTEAWTEGLAPRSLVKGAGSPLPTANEVEIRRRKKEVVEEIEGAGTIRALRMAIADRAAPRDLYALHQCVLRVFFDGRKQPHIEAPLVDFFGSGFDLRQFNSLAVGTAGPTDMPMPGKRASDQVFMYCFFPMPFSDGFKVEIENFGDRTITFLVQTLVDRDVPVIPDPANPPRERLRFNAGFRTVDPATQLDLPILETTGRGRIVGCVLNIDCPRAVWWGEGDDKVWIDGEKFPSYFGTGSEDYLGDAWGLREHIQPLQGVTLKRDYGKNSSYRWHVPDSIDFHNSVRFTIENWQFGGYKDTYYATVVYWYGEPDAPRPFEPLKPADLEVPGLRIPDSIEIEGRVQAAANDGGAGGEAGGVIAPPGGGAGNVVKDKYARGAEYSGGEAFRVAGDQPVKIDLSAEKDRWARLALRVNPRQPFETITVTPPGGAGPGLPPRTIEYNVDSDGVYDIGIVRLSAGRNLFTVQCSKPATLDCWIARTVEVRSAHGVEAEMLPITGSQGTNHTEQPLGRPALSAGSQVWCRATQPGAWIEFELPVAKPGKYKLSVVYTTSYDYGLIQTWVDGRKAGEPADTFGTLEVGPIRELGTFDLSGPTKIKCEVTGKAEKSPGYYFGVDCFIIEPAK
jgi:hypothetical protein